MLPYLLTCAILFLSTLTRSTLGFGDAVVAMPLLALALGIRTAASLVALVATTSTIIILWSDWQVVDVKGIWRVVLAVVLDIPCGLLLLRDVSAQLMQALLGVFIVALSLYNLVQPGLALRQDRWALGYVFGFLAGLFGGAYNTVDPLLVVYGHLRRWPPEYFRATLQGCFFPAYVLIVVGHAMAGLLTTEVLTLYSVSLPVVSLAVFLGQKLNAALSRERFARYVNMALVVIGGILCLQSSPF
jgi:uncharacterized membrane protein YfcA